MKIKESQRACFFTWKPTGAMPIALRLHSKTMMTSETTLLSRMDGFLHRGIQYRTLGSKISYQTDSNMYRTET